MSLTYILMYHPHIDVFGGVHVAYIHLDVSSTYIRFLVGFMSLTYILMYHPHIYVFGGVPCRLHTS